MLTERLSRFHREDATPVTLAHRLIATGQNLLRPRPCRASTTMRYNPACYECQLGCLDHAGGWLEKASALGGARKMQMEALGDPDLEMLWGELKS
jgi:hypothetical protein